MLTFANCNGQIHRHRLWTQTHRCCRSIPGIYCDVLRPKKMTVRYYNEDLQEVTEEFDNFACRMIQHELSHLEDERFTSVLAQRALIDGGAKKSERREKGSVDKISAALILQSYLDRQSGSSGVAGMDPLNVPDSLSRNKTRRRK